jgi:hypothetical protein
MQAAEPLGVAASEAPDATAFMLTPELIAAG